MDKVISNEINNGNISIKKKDKITSPHRLSKRYSELLEKKKSKSKRRSSKKINKNKKDKKNKKIIIKPILGTPIFIKTKEKKKNKKSFSNKSKIQLPNKTPAVKETVPKKNRRFSKKKLHKKHTKSRKISFTCYPQNNKNVKDVIKKADKMSNEQIKKELLNEGIEIKSDKNKLLKDIYMFTSMGGIKINRE